MEDKERREAIKWHVAGATVLHKGKFDNLNIPQNEKELDKAFVEKFVLPFYNNIGTIGINVELLSRETRSIFDEIDAEVVESLLSYFNWRTRIVGAYFAAIKNIKELEDLIGMLLLKSEVAYTGKVYCMALAEFNNQKSIDFLNQYLDYYLTQKDLWFDQIDAMAALAYLDKLNSTKEFNKHLSKWSDFISDKESLSLTQAIISFEKNMIALNEIKKHIS
ncbi:DUF6000 family protein [Pontibacter mangrovi]|uniref:DNA alkylation repair protein n=1 Tax=Pontibacter mangrovi TaxID=2589816 RepID=A0A501WCI5_9BACT|nr:DUF6000 family protein [Pontibacter mangrovi]TPE43206.1 hypothetical protein FJM65_13905 [Pontibacter mangrovi]